MPSPAALTLSKKERLSSRRFIDNLFKGCGSRSMSAFPLRVVYKQIEREVGEPSVRILVSVPKRCFKHAVDRNRVKRQVREAYRHHKDIIAEETGIGFIIAFIWLDSKHHSSAEIDNRVVRLLSKVGEKR